MIATPCQRNRLMQKLRAETWIRRKNGIYAIAEGTKCRLDVRVSLSRQIRRVLRGHRSHDIDRAKSALRRSYASV
jgi:hypothetical protein